MDLSGHAVAVAPALTPQRWLQATRHPSEPLSLPTVLGGDTQPFALLSAPRPEAPSMEVTARHCTPRNRIHGVSYDARVGCMGGMYRWDIWVRMYVCDAQVRCSPEPLQLAQQRELLWLGSSHTSAMPPVGT